MNQAIKERSAWFMHARFGMFIHWGLYAIPARGEWVMSREQIPVSKYEKYFREFNPRDYRPAEWAKLAKRAGMKYAVLTAKHHDGFCLFDSEYTDYTSTHTPCGRDLVREFVEAFRAEGIKVGLYYSLLDWHHPDYPKYSDRIHPMRGNPAYKDEPINFDRYLTYMHNQIRELVTKYGKLDLLWFDYSYDNMRCDTWKAEELIKMVRSYQPDVLIDNRLEGAGDHYGSIMTANPTSYCGDFASPEQLPPLSGLFDENGEAVPWELCATMNNHWGYHHCDQQYKSPTLLIRKLVDCVSKGGNMILNVGPDADGRIPDRSVEILEQIGEWMSRNSESVYNCSMSTAPVPEWGRYTQHGNIIYAHIFDCPLGPLPLTGIRSDQINTVRYLADGSEVNMNRSVFTSLYPDSSFASLGENPAFTYPLPDDRDTVLKIELRQE